MLLFFGTTRAVTLHDNTAQLKQNKRKQGSRQRENKSSLVFRSVPFCDDCKIIVKQHVLCGIEDLLNLCVRFSISGLLLGAPPTR